MALLLYLFGAGLFFELALHVMHGFWRVRKVLAILASILTAVATVLLIARQFNLWSFAIAALGLYRIFNNFRVIKGRMHENFLWVATLRSSFVLAFFQLLVTGAWLAWNTWHTTGHTTWIVVASLQLAAAACSLASMLRTIKRTSWPAGQKHYSDKELPTLSVAIPARNETDDLQFCLKSLLASDYPKLEILVLDDCSQDKRTPEIIRSFAHDGVRFVKGEEPDKTWLAKNQAYDRLMNEASGDYVLFCGVDVRFSPDSLRKLISLMLARQKTMVSVLPTRDKSAYGATSLVQAMRYWWELVPPRRLVDRPPVISSCWVVARTALKKSGGFRAVARSIVPEAFFARYAARSTDGYSFLRAGLGIGIESVKTVAEQRDTAIRMRYPQVHRRPEQVAFQTFAEYSFLLMPFALSLGGFVVDIGVVAQIIATLACLCLVITHELVVLSTRVNTWWFGLFAPPFMILGDIALLHYSMWKYEFSVVEWRGRNICIPAMHVIPHLPKI